MAYEDPHKALEATVSGEPEAKSQKHNGWRDLSVAEPQLHHCAFILITDNPPDRHCSAKKQLQNFDNLTIEPLVDSQHCSRLFSPPTLSRCDKSALRRAFLLCSPESIRVLFPIWHRNKAVHFVCLVSKSSFLYFILLKLLGGAANTVWTGHHSIHKGRFLKYLHGLASKTSIFFTVVIRHHKESNQIVGSFTYNK